MEIATEVEEQPSSSRGYGKRSQASSSLKGLTSFETSRMSNLTGWLLSKSI